MRVLSCHRTHRGTDFKDGVLVGLRNGEEYRIADDKPVQEFYLDVWQGFSSPTDAEPLVRRVLANASLWGKDLTVVPNLVEEVAGHLAAILEKGIGPAMQEVA